MLLVVHVGVSTLFATAASTENAKRYKFVCNLFVVPPLPVPKVTPEIVPFSKQQLTIM